MAAMLIIVGVLILAAIGMLIGMKLGDSRRQEITQAQTDSLAAESKAKAAADEAAAKSAAALLDASAKDASSAAKQKEEEAAASMLAEQTKEANRENSETLKGIAAAGIPNVSAYADAVRNAQTISAQTISGTASSASSAASSASTAAGTNGHTVCIDAGHQTHVYDSNVEPIGPGSSTNKLAVSSGTNGVVTGMEEYELNLEVALKLQTELTARGYGVVMTRTVNDVQLTNIDRAEIANNSGAQIMVRIHANSVDDSSVRGALTYGPATDNPYLSKELISASDRLATDVINAFCASTGAKNRGVLEDNELTGVNWSKVPVTYVEMGFMSNAEDDQLMVTEDYQKQMVRGIADGIDQYFAGN
jgi:N-acetylmuramoyl-L-alanine amidase